MYVFALIPSYMHLYLVLSIRIALCHVYQHRHLHALDVPSLIVILSAGVTLESRLYDEVYIHMLVHNKELEKYVFFVVCKGRGLYLFEHCLPNVGR